MHHFESPETPKPLLTPLVTGDLAPHFVREPRKSERHFSSPAVCLCIYRPVKEDTGTLKAHLSPARGTLHSSPPSSHFLVDLYRSDQRANRTVCGPLNITPVPLLPFHSASFGLTLLERFVHADCPRPSPPLPCSPGTLGHLQLPRACDLLGQSKFSTWVSPPTQPSLKILMFIILKFLFALSFYIFWPCHTHTGS